PEQMRYFIMRIQSKPMPATSPESAPEADIVNECDHQFSGKNNWTRTCARPGELLQNTAARHDIAQIYNADSCEHSS
ncbi:MAG: hypothetical protein ACI4W2_01910, partial [Eubacterium sp.]